MNSLSLCSEWYSRRWTCPWTRKRETAFSGLQQCGMYLTNSFTCTYTGTRHYNVQLHLYTGTHSGITMFSFTCGTGTHSGITMFSFTCGTGTHSGITMFSFTCTQGHTVALQCSASPVHRDTQWHYNVQLHLWHRDTQWHYNVQLHLWHRDTQWHYNVQLHLYTGTHSGITMFSFTCTQGHTVALQCSASPVHRDTQWHYNVQLHLYTGTHSGITMFSFTCTQGHTVALQCSASPVHRDTQWHYNVQLHLYTGTHSGITMFSFTCGTGTHSGITMFSFTCTQGHTVALQCSASPVHRDTQWHYNVMATTPTHLQSACFWLHTHSGT